MAKRLQRVSEHPCRLRRLPPRHRRPTLGGKMRILKRRTSTASQTSISTKTPSETTSTSLQTSSPARTPSTLATSTRKRARLSQTTSTPESSTSSTTSERRLCDCHRVRHIHRLWILDVGIHDYRIYRYHGEQWRRLGPRSRHPAVRPRNIPSRPQTVRRTFSHVAVITPTA
jgi:hypothetical protein